MLQPRTVCILAIAALALAGCGPRTETVEDRGSVCLSNRTSDDSDRQSGVEPGRIEAAVAFPDCLSSTCSEVIERDCTVSRKGDTLTVESRFVVSSESGTCSADCWAPSTSCTLPDDLEAGDYELVHGDQSMSFSLPSDETICGAGNSPVEPQ